MKPLTVTIHIGGKQVDRLTEEQRARLAQNLSNAMSTYYTANPIEFSQMKGTEK